MARRGVRRRKEGGALVLAAGVVVLVQVVGPAFEEGRSSDPSVTGASSAAAGAMVAMEVLLLGRSSAGSVR